MPPVTDQAVCIRQWDWSETSQTVSLFTRTMGLVRGLAKGSRRPKSPYSGGIELLTRAETGIINRPAADLALITEWNLLETFPALRRSLDAHHIGLYVADLVHHAITDRDPHPALYDAMIEALRTLEQPETRQVALLAFQWSVLAETGYRPVIDADVRTGETFDEPRRYAFSPELGGLVRSGRRAGSEPTPEHTWHVSAATIVTLRRLGAGEPIEDAQTDVVHRANRLLAAYLRYILGREPRTLPVLFGDRLPR